MPRRRDQHLGLDLTAGRPPRENGGLSRVREETILPLVKEEFSRNGCEAPRSDRLPALARFIAGYLRTSSGLWPVSDELACEHVVVELVGALVRRGSPAALDRRLAPLIDAAFVQRGKPLPSEATIVALAAVVGARLARRGSPASPLARVQLVDWVVAVVLAAEDE